MNSYVSSIYTNEVHNNLRPLYPNWEPTQPVSLGDYGLLEGAIFVRLGNISDIGIKFNGRQDNRTDQKFFTSHGNTEVKFNAAGSAPAGGTVSVKANVEVNFSSERAVFFNAAACQYSMIADKVAVGDEVMRRYKERNWQRAWTVVTDVITAGATSIAVSGASSSSIILEANGNVPNIDLADASVGLSLKSARNVGYQIVASQGLVPLIGLSRIKPRFLWFDEGFQPLRRNVANPLTRRKGSNEIKTEGSAQELIFAQVE